MTHPFDALTPDAVLDALAGVGLHGDGRLLALSSYENRVYQVYLDLPPGDSSTPAVVVAKFYRPGRWSEAQILEEHRFAAELAAAEVPCVPPLILDGRSLHRAGDFWFSVSPRQGGRRPELDDEDVLTRIGRFLARLHLVGRTRGFDRRPALDPLAYGAPARDWLLAHGDLPPEVAGRWREVSGQALEMARGIWDEVTGREGLTLLRLHGDCHPGNILWTEDRPGAPGTPGLPGGPHFVDLDDARSGVAVQDLWMLLSGSRAEQTRQLGALLDGYDTLCEFDRRELALIEPLRTLRLIHYSVWLAQRRDDPSFAINFPWFDGAAYWQGQVDTLTEQLEAMAEPPLVA